MKYLYTFLLLFAFSSAALAQRTATASSPSDFKYHASGTVESHYALNSALSNDEAENIMRWATANAPSIEIVMNQNRTEITLLVSNEYNIQAIYQKTFAQTGISDIAYTHNGISKNYSVIDFLNAVDVNP